MTKWLGEQEGFVSLIWPAFILPWVQGHPRIPSRVSRAWAPWETAQASLTVEGRIWASLWAPPVPGSCFSVWCLSHCLWKQMIQGAPGPYEGKKMHPPHNAFLSFCPRETHTDIHSCLHTHTHAHTYAHTDTCTDIYTLCRYIYTHVHKYTHVHTYAHALADRHTQEDTHTDIYIHVHTHMHAWTPYAWREIYKKVHSLTCLGRNLQAT